MTLKDGISIPDWDGTGSYYSCTVCSYSNHWNTEQALLGYVFDGTIFKADQKIDYKHLLNDDINGEDGTQDETLAKFSFCKDGSFTAGREPYTTNPTSNVPRGVYFDDMSTNYYAGDFNGDGADEILKTSKSYRHYIQLDYVMHPSGEYLVPVYAGDQILRVEILDFDFDGQDEIIVFGEKNSLGYTGSILKFNGTEFITLSNIGENMFNREHSSYGDFNGDGKMDFINYYGTVSQMGLYIYNGIDYTLLPLPSDINKPSDFSNNGEYLEPYTHYDYFYYNKLGACGYSENGLTVLDPHTYQPVKSVELNPDGRSYKTYTSLQVADINNDGKSDILILVGDTVKVLVSNGDITFTTQSYVISSLGNDKIYTADLRLIDNTRDGQPEILFRGRGYWPTVFECVLSDLSKHETVMLEFDSKLNNDKFVNKITNGQGVETSIIYDSYKNFNPATKSSEDPISVSHGPVKTVYNITTKTIIGSTERTIGNTDYTYESLKVHNDKGLIGFSKITSINKISNNKTIYTYAYDPDIFDSYLNKVELYNGTSKLSSTTYSKLFDKRTNKTYFSYIPTIVEYDNRSGQCKTTETNISATSGLVNWKKETYDGDGSILTSYSNYIKSNPRTITQTRTQGGGSFSTTQTIVYTNEGNIFTLTDKVGNVVTYTYNTDRTTVATVKSTGNDGHPDPLIKFSYDNTKRFVNKKETIIGGITATETFDLDAEGRPLRSVAPNDMVTVAAYDMYGNQYLSIAPNGRRTTTSYGWSAEPGAVSYSKTKDDLGNISISHFDNLGRLVKKETKATSRPDIISTFTYNAKGQLITEVNNGESITYTYDTKGRLSSSTTPQGVTDYTYSGGKTNSSFNGTVSSKTLNAFGQVEESVDAGGTLKYTFHPTGQVAAITLNGNTVSQMEYDAVSGLQTALTDPSAGRTSYTYTNTGSLKTQTDINGNATTITYDNFNRVVKKLTTNGTSSRTVNYNYSADTRGLLLSEECFDGASANKVTKAYKYNTLGMVLEETTNIDSKNYTFAYNYDIDGKLLKTTYPDGVAVETTYTGNYITNIKELGSGKNVFKCLLTDYNNFDLLTGYTQTMANGSATTVQRPFDSRHMADYISFWAGSNLITYDYSFNTVTQNLESKVRKVNSAPPIAVNNETYTFDDADRLKTWSMYYNTAYKMNYASNGNIVEKSDFGYFGYDSGKPNSVEAVYNLAGGAINTYTSQVSYTLFNKVSSMTKQTSTANLKTYGIVYGPNDERCKTFTSNGESTIYLGAYEVRSNGDVLHYISSPAGPCALLVTNTAASKRDMFYLYTDYQGSLLAAVKNDGSVVQEFSYDPWGRRRNPDNWADYNVLPDQLGANASQLFTRGYTFHEHIDEYGLINMNGRMYDPRLGRMLSPDILVQDPYNSQSFNRYTYCFNNPLKYSDPTGYVAGCDAYGRPTHDENGNFIHPDDREGGQHPSEAIQNKYANPNYRGEDSYQGYYNAQKFLTLQFKFFDYVETVHRPGNPDLLGIRHYRTVEFAEPITGSSGESGNQSTGGSFLQSAANVADAINQYNPVSAVLDNVAYAFTGCDLRDRPMSQSSAYLNVLAVAPIPIGKIGSLVYKTGAKVVANSVEKVAAKTGGRAFFSGAATEARAIEEGFTTLGQTDAGINLAKMTKGMDYYGPINGQPASQAWQWWARLSSTYAKGIPNGSTVNVFLNNPSPTGIWNLIERPILEQKGINIIIH